MKRFFLFFLFPFFLFAEKQVVDLQQFGKIVGHFENGLCNKIVRLTPEGEIKYEHVYHYDDHGKVIAESLIGQLGTIEYSGNPEDGFLMAKSSFGEETWSKDDQCVYEEVDIEKVYDVHGNLIQKGTNRYFYDEGKLVLVGSGKQSVLFAYDQEGRKIAKKTISESGEEEEFYLYLGMNEIGSVSQDGSLKWLRIPGITMHPDMVRAIAIETKDAIYAPIYDLRWNIVKLVNIENGEVIETRPDPFGQNLHELKGCPWTFCSKRYDPDVGLVDFGYREYDPELREWTTLDPLMQDSNPYRYCFGNPLQYIDPDGQFAIAVVTWTGTAFTSPLWGPGALALAGGAAIGYLGYKGYQCWQEKYGEKEPPYNGKILGIDPSQSPGEDFEWRGRGDPKSGEGSWFNTKTKESLHPDFDHPAPISPHWDYINKEKEEARLYPDGSYEWKKKK